MCETTNVICRCALEYLKRLTVLHTCFAKSLCPLCAFARLSTGKKDRRPARVKQQQAAMFLTPPSRLKFVWSIRSEFRHLLVRRRREYSRHFVSTWFVSKDVSFKSRSDQEKHWNVMLIIRKCSSIIVLIIVQFFFSVALTYAKTTVVRRFICHVSLWLKRT